MFRWCISLCNSCSTSKKIPPISHEILKVSAVEVARRIRYKEITSIEVLEACIARIKDINTTLNCLIDDRFEAAFEEARQADELVRQWSETPDRILKEKPFLGVPFTTKDSIGVNGLLLAAGIYMRKNCVADKDAEVIKLLRDKGAIIIGLTNVPELCMWWETHNQIYGRTNNPYDTRRIVGGSSGGEGAIQAAGGSIFGIGSDIGGSIRMPAFFNGIFGHKPSRYIVSNQGQYPEPEGVDGCLSIGPMTRHAADLKAILNVISGENNKKLNLDSPVNIRDIKIHYQLKGIPKTDPVDKEIELALKGVVEYLNKEYNIDAAEQNINLGETMGIWFACLTSDKNTVSSYIMKDTSTCTIRKEILKSIFGCSQNSIYTLLIALNEGKGVKYGSKAHQSYLRMRVEMEEEFKNILGENGVLLFPTHPTAALYHNEPMLRSMNFAYTAVINSLGFPATAVPLGLNKQGLPIGIQIVANINNDRLCLALAEELEKAFGGWIEP